VCSSDLTVRRFDHFSPYVIAGDPGDDTNPMSGQATGGLVMTGRTTGKASVTLSVDQGQSRIVIANVTGRFELDLTDHVKGRYGWQVEFTCPSGVNLQVIKFTTVCQMAQPMYPRLKANGSKVVYRVASRAVRPMLPNWRLSAQELQDAGVVNERFTSANLKYTPRGVKQRTAYTTTNNKPGFAAFNVTSSGQLLEVRGAARFRIRVPSPKGCDFNLDLSTDDGKTWQPLGRAEIPADNEYSSGWMYGKRDVSQAKTKSAIVRAHVYAGGYTTGLIDADLYGVYRTAPPQSARITYGWKENGRLKTHVENINAGRSEHAFTVPTGDRIVDEFVRIEAK